MPSLVHVFFALYVFGLNKFHKCKILHFIQYIKVQLNKHILDVNNKNNGGTQKIFV